jgi:hypothetical protein
LISQTKIMTKITLGGQGQVDLFRLDSNRQQLELGTEFILETTETGLELYYVRPDVQRVYIEVTTVCNLDCAMCIRREWHDPRGSMTAQTFQSIFEGLKAFPNLKRVVFSGYGEPLTHPYLVDMIAQLHSLGVGITLVTNGLLLERPLAEALLRAGVDTLFVSLDSLHVQAYQQAGFSQGQNQVLDNLGGVSELIRDSGWGLPILGIEYVATRSNLGELQQLPNLARQIGASILIVNNLLPHARDLSQEILYDRSEPLQLGGCWGIHRAGWIALGTTNLPRMKWGADRKCRFINEHSLRLDGTGGLARAWRSCTPTPITSTGGVRRSTGMCWVLRGNRPW